MAGGRRLRYDSRTNFLTEDILIEILLRLPVASCIGRFRCVCRAWRNLLSDPYLLRRILFFQSPDDRKTLRILIAGQGESCPLNFNYTSHSYETLAPIARSRSYHSFSNSPSYPRKIAIVGCCDGIFCITDDPNSYNVPGSAPEILLLNPATSETKILPPCPAHPVCNGVRYPIFLREERTGFGFDPRTEDYKVIRVLQFEVDTLPVDLVEDDVDPALIYQGRGHRLVFTEVYSSRNDSWKRVSQSNDHIGGRWGVPSINVNQQRDTFRNEKCYWFHNDHRDTRACSIISFDMATEAFALAPVPQPSGLDRESEWLAKSCFMSKGAFMATFVDEVQTANEIWALLKYGAAESWTKLFTFRPPPGRNFFTCLEVWKDGIYICCSSGYGFEETDGDEFEEPDKLFCFDPATSEIIDDDLEMEGTVGPFHAHTYVPTRVSLSLACCRVIGS